MSENQQPAEPGFDILRHYLRDLSFENPHGPLERTRTAEVVFSLEIGVSVERLPGDAYRESLDVQARGWLGEHTVVLAEVEYVAEVKLHLVPEPVVDHVLGVEVPKVLIEFVKRVLEQNSRFAGYPPIRIGNIDFRAIHYANRPDSPVH